MNQDSVTDMCATRDVPANFPQQGHSKLSPQKMARTKQSDGQKFQCSEVSVKQPNCFRKTTICNGLLRSHNGSNIDLRIIFFMFPIINSDAHAKFRLYSMISSIVFSNVGYSKDI